MYTAYLLIGGNLGDRTTYLKRAATEIEQYCGKIVQYSSIYETEPWGNTEQPGFFNQCLEVKTSLTPENLMKTLLQIESKLGRVRAIKMGPRTIDLDILLIDQLIIANDLLTIPHPEMANRRFALSPLNEIAPELLHPVLKKTINNLLIACADPLDVQKKTFAT